MTQASLPPEQTQATTQAASARILSLDIFRAIAVILVLLFHFTYRIPPEHLNAAESPLLIVYWGWIGVFLFFVISGFCISETLSRAEGSAMFLLRRVSRIYPTYIFAVCLAFLFVSVAPVPEFDMQSGTFYFIESGPVNFIANLLFLRELGFPWIDGVYWSLLVEIKFYFVIAVFYAVTRRVNSARDIFLIMSLAFSSAWLLAEFISLDIVAKILKHGIIAPYLPFFALGILMNRHPLLTSTDQIRTSWIFQAVFLLLGNMALFALDGTAAAITAFNLLLCVMALTIFNKAFRQYFEQKLLLLVPLGTISYSLYLFHNNIGLTAIRELNKYMNYNLSIIIATALVLIISTISYKLAEQFASKKFLKMGKQILHARTSSNPLQVEQ